MTRVLDAERALYFTTCTEPRDEKPRLSLNGKPPPSLRLDSRVRSAIELIGTHGGSVSCDGRQFTIRAKDGQTQRCRSAGQLLLLADALAARLAQKGNAQ